MNNKIKQPMIWVVLLCGISSCAKKDHLFLNSPALGDYLRNDYLMVLEESKSPLRAIQSGPVQSITIKADAKGLIFQSILGFQEGGPVYLLQYDGKITTVDRVADNNNIVSIKLLDSNHVIFGFGNNNPVTYTFVGNAAKFVAEKSIVGRYTDRNNVEYLFNKDGTAIFPDKKFTYQIGLFYPPSFKKNYYTSDYEDYAYTFFGDTLTIFNVSGGSLFEGGTVQNKPWLILYRQHERLSEPHNNKANKLAEKSNSYTLISKSGRKIGTVYAPMFNDSLFTTLSVVDKKDTIYKIDGSFFYNTQGKDIEVSNDKFFGYTFVLKRKDYFVVRLYGDSGRTVSDNITIEWNERTKIMEVQKTP